ncbi:MAG: TetR/AcrR family transcriptional regulator, partial [bacterium]
TTKDIAEQAEVAELTLFRHSNSKEQLLEEVLKRFSFLPALEVLLPQVADLPYEEALVLIATRFLEALHARRERIRMMLSKNNAYPLKLRKVYHAFMSTLTDTMASYFEHAQKCHHRRGCPGLPKITALLGPHVPMSFVGRGFIPAVFYLFLPPSISRYKILPYSLPWGFVEREGEELARGRTLPLPIVGEVW